MMHPEYVSDLVGRIVWHSNHMGDSRGFSIGERIPKTTYKGTPVVVGTYALHIQCPWRLIDNDGSVIASDSSLGDLPPEQITDKVNAFLGDGLIVVSATSDLQDNLVIHLAGGAEIQVSPVLGSEEEAWRLFRPTTADAHDVRPLGIDSKKAE